MSKIVFAAKNSWTTLRMSTPLFVGSYLQVTWWALGRWKFASNDNCYCLLCPMIGEYLKSPSNHQSVSHPVTFRGKGKFPFSYQDWKSARLNKCRSSSESKETVFPGFSTRIIYRENWPEMTNDYFNVINSTLFKQGPVVRRPISV